MAELHNALKSLGPCNFSDIPTSLDDLDAYVSELFSQSQLVVESIPIGPPDESPARSRSQTVSSVASNASEVSISSARSAPPPAEYAALQKEWGKAIKLTAKENPLGMSVYKLGGKDSRGAWFARRSVHEGLSFARFKKGLEREFPESTAVQGAPGQGNIRGIGGEKKYEDIDVKGKARVEVYHLSAQFPGPTTPRDFVTFLVTSSKAMKEGAHQSKIPELSPRHYMILSKPCTHLDCPERSGMIRGSYESVEFIREVPRKLRKSISALNMETQQNNRSSASLEKDMARHTAEKKLQLHDSSRSTDDLADHAESRSLDGALPARKRSVTVGLPRSPLTDRKYASDVEFYDPEQNPVEWIMVTRSDPGGSVPRWMVERGTPSSIVADASKFLDWACQKEHPGDEELDMQGLPSRKRQDSFQSWQANGHLAGIDEQPTPADEGTGEPFPSMASSSASIEPQHAMASSGLLAGMTSVVSSAINNYAPQAVLDRLPVQSGRQTPTLSTETTMTAGSKDVTGDAHGDDASSTISSTSFASADSHLEDEDTSASPAQSAKSTASKQDPYMTAHEKELAKLAQRRAALDAKLKSDREKVAKDVDSQTAKEKDAVKKAEEKHEKEMKKSEEKYKKEVAKLEEKKRKEAKKIEERQKKQADKDEKAKLTRERDEARSELELLKREQEVWKKQVGDLQAENTKLVARISKLDAGAGIMTPAAKVLEAETGRRQRADTVKSQETSGGRSRSSSLNFRSLKPKEIL